MEVFKDYAYYYNAFYQDKDYKAEATQVDVLLKKYGSNIHKIINFGCGTGRHDIELAKLGYQCTGIDISASMIDVAKQNAKGENSSVDFSVADIRFYQPEKQYDAIVSLFHVMSYQNGNQDILAAFQAARKTLRKKGVFLFDVWYGPGVLSDKPSIRVKQVEDKSTKIIRIAKPVIYEKKNVVDVNYEVLVMDKETCRVQIINEAHSMRYFFRPELEFLLNEAGFELMDNMDCRTLNDTDFYSWTSYFVARAV